MRKISTEPNQVSMLQVVPIRCPNPQPSMVKNWSQQFFFEISSIWPLALPSFFLRNSKFQPLIGSRNSDPKHSFSVFKRMKIKQKLFIGSVTLMVTLIELVQGPKNRPITNIKCDKLNRNDAHCAPIYSKLPICHCLMVGGGGEGKMWRRLL